MTSAADDRSRAGRGVARSDVAPGDETIDRDEAIKGFKGYLVGLAIALALTGISFYLVRSTLVWRPSVPVALSVLAIAQMGVHLVFFLHITTGKDNINNVMALGFGLLIVLLLVCGSLWIMGHLSHSQMSTEQMMKMQR